MLQLSLLALHYSPSRNHISPRNMLCGCTYTLFLTQSPLSLLQSSANMHISCNTPHARTHTRFSSLSLTHTLSSPISTLPPTHILQTHTHLHCRFRTLTAYPVRAMRRAHTHTMGVRHQTYCRLVGGHMQAQT